VTVHTLNFPDSEKFATRLAALFERLISEGDSDVHDLTHDGLDGLWGCEERDFVAKHFGPKTREVWERICAGEHGQ